MKEWSEVDVGSSTYGMTDVVEQIVQEQTDGGSHHDKEDDEMSTPTSQLNDSSHVDVDCVVGNELDVCLPCKVELDLWNECVAGEGTATATTTRRRRIREYVHLLVVST